MSGGVSVLCWLAAPVAMLFERRKDFAVRTELEIDVDFEFREPKWRGESVTFEVLNSFY